MKTSAKPIHATCDFCKTEAIYDAPTKLGPWAYMCEACYKQNGLKNEVGTKLRKEEKKTSSRYLKEPSLAKLQKMMFDGIALAACEHGCEVEPDGYCEHGKPSWLIKLEIL